MSLYVYPFNHYFDMWNELDPERVRGHLDQAVTEDFIFCDPLHWHLGRSDLHDNVRQFREQYPKVTLEVTSGFDHHHNRFRYEWAILRKGRTMMTGLDIATVADSGHIERIDGFFGAVPQRSSDSPDASDTPQL